MARGLLYVETRPSAPEREAEYHAWYEEVHLPEVVSLDGFVSARRLAPVDGTGPFVALYELEADDLQTAVDNLQGAAERGELRMSDSVQMTPAPVMRLWEITAVHDPVRP